MKVDTVCHSTIYFVKQMHKKRNLGKKVWHEAFKILGQCLFVCVEVLRPSQPNGVMSSAVSLPNHIFTGQA